MHNGRYLFGFFFFFVFLSILLMFIWPSGPGNSKITSYFTKPVGNIHYSQVQEGTNMTTCITIENTPFNAFDLINYSFKAMVILDTVLGSDLNLAVRDWDSNFTLYRNEIITIKLNFTASDHGYEVRGIFIVVEWGEIALTEYSRMAGLQVGPTEEVQSAFDFASAMILISSLGLGVMLLIIVVTARQDFQTYRKRTPPPQRPAPTTTPIPSAISPEAPSAHPPISSAPPSPPLSAPLEHRHVETMILIPCPRCGSKIDKSQTVCPTCGHEFQKCVVCNLIIEEDEQVETCPECGALGHRDHFREWVHVNGKCPICKKPLTF